MIKRLTLTDEEAIQILGYSNKSGRYKFSCLKKWQSALDKRTDIRNGTTTNQYKPNRKVLTALNDSNELMTIDEYCEFYKIPRDEVRSYKLVTHTGVPYYNIASSNVEDVTAGNTELYDFILNHKPDYSFIKDLPEASKNLLVLDIADLHIGKLSRASETGEEYNTEIAMNRAQSGVSGILSKSKAFNIDRVMFVIGNDVMHIDNAKSTTTSGTFQDSDSMFYDMFNNSLELYVKIIESLAMSYKVDIIFNPSNHDYVSGFMLARAVGIWFKDCPNVTINDTIAHRKYYKYGNNMIATSHGDGAKLADVPLLMATEQPIMWAETKYRYCYLHHLHHKQVHKFQSAKDYIGVTVEHLRSPSSADSWHYRNGYVSKAAIEGFIHSFEDGQIARITNYF